MDLAWLGLVLGGCTGVIRTGRYSGLEFGCLLVTALVMAIFLGQWMERQIDDIPFHTDRPNRTRVACILSASELRLSPCCVSDFEIKCCGGCDYVRY